MTAEFGRAFAVEKFGILFCLLSILPINLYCQDDCLLKYQAGLLFSERNYTEAIETYKQMQSQQYNKYYNISVCFCILELRDSAEYYLQKAIDHNFYYPEHFRYNNITNLASDKNLSCLSNNRKLDSLLNENYEKMNANINKELQEKFVQRLVIDQKVRHQEDYDSLCNVYNVKKDYLCKFIDSINMEFLDSVINVYGKWTGINFIGQKGDHAAWIIAQHADYFIDFQEKCYTLILEAYEKNNTDYTNIPYLYDRIMINKNLKQRYGTQMRFIDDKVVFINIENEDENYVNMLRTCYRLGSLKDYKEILEKKYVNKK